jgi:hypothetical protein
MGFSEGLNRTASRLALKRTLEKALRLGRRAPEQFRARIGLLVPLRGMRPANRALRRNHPYLVPMPAIEAVKIARGSRRVASIHRDLLGVPGRGALVVPVPVMISHRSADRSKPLRQASAIASLIPGKSRLLLRAGFPLAA